MKVIANRQLHGEYGDANPDQLFECRDHIAEQLLASGLVRHPLPPKVEYEIKIIKPEAPEVSPRDPFRDRIVPDAKPETVDSEGNKVLSGANIFENRTPDPVGRGAQEEGGPAGGRGEN